MTDNLFSPAIRWQNRQLSLLDQRLLPHQVQWHTYTDATSTAQAIRDMVVRGAPAIGIAAAYGVALDALRLPGPPNRATLQASFEVLAQSRPTAVNLFWALDRMGQRLSALEQQNASDDQIRQQLVDEALQIHRDDAALNLQLAEHGAALLTTDFLSQAGKKIYTHCNTGALATGGHGTALGIIRTAFAKGLISGVVAGETRPWMQGSRLTSWELQQDQIPVTLVADSAAGHVMQQGDIAAVIVGADRITANGDTANKIGTYNLAVLARHHGIPFIVAAPCSTIDLQLASGAEIDIEQRQADEVRHIQGVAIAPQDVPVFNPAFDVTPHALISAIVT